MPKRWALSWMSLMVMGLPVGRSTQASSHSFPVGHAIPQVPASTLASTIFLSAPPKSPKRIRLAKALTSTPAGQAASQGALLHIRQRDASAMPCSRVIDLASPLTACVITRDLSVGDPTLQNLIM
jgi:hypothetical protein